MKRVFLEYLPAWLLLTVFLLIVLHAPLTVYAGTHWPAVALPIKAWKEALIVLAALLVGWQVARRGLWRRLRGDVLVWLVLGFWAIHIGSLAWTDAGVQAIVAGLLIDLRYTVYAVTVYCFLRLYPGYGASFVRVGIVGAVIVLGFAALQLVIPADSLKYLGYSKATIAPYLTVDENPDYIRLNSTLRGPNPLGAYAVIALACCLAYVVYEWKNRVKIRAKWMVVALGLASVLALWHSYSRSAVLAALAVVCLVLAVRYGGRLRQRHWYYIVSSFVVAIAVLAGVWETSFVQNVVLHNNPSTGANVDSNAGHMTSLVEGAERTLAEPFGGGVGSTGSASLLGDSPLIIENQYFMIAHEAGWAALVLFLAMVAVILRRLWYQRQDWLSLAVWSSGIGLAVIGLLLPVWADDTVSLVWWGLAAVALAKGGAYGTTTDKKAA